VILVEEAFAAAVTQGMDGTAQDYVIFPGPRALGPGESFQLHVRHLLVPTADKDLAEELPKWWSAFHSDHARVHALWRAVPDAP
jgi:hypothetical protein